MHRTIPALLACLLCACTQEPPPPPARPIAYDGPSYRFNVASINVAQDYKSPRHLPNVEHLADVTPAQAVKKWASVRLTAAGHVNSLEVGIKDASILRKDLPKEKTGLEGMFTTEQTEQYDGTLEVEMKIYTPDRTLPAAHLDVVAHRTLTLPENAAPIDRERTYHRITNDLMESITPQLDEQIHRYLGNYLY